MAAPSGRPVYAGSSPGHRFAVDRPRRPALDRPLIRCGRRDWVDHEPHADPRPRACRGQRRRPPAGPRRRQAARRPGDARPGGRPRGLGRPADRRAVGRGPAGERRQDGPELRVAAPRRAGSREIITHGRAYELHIDRDQVDACRLERLVADAARGAGNGNAARAALALFRGDPLADIADEPFAIDEIRRLDELRLTAAELAIDADLADGPPPGAGRRDRRAAGRQPAARATPRPADARALPLRASGRGARGLPACSRDAGRGDRHRAVGGAAAPARGDPAPGSLARRRARRARAAARARRFGAAAADRPRDVLERLSPADGARRDRRRVRDGEDARRRRDRG